MSLASLLAPPNPAFLPAWQFDHMMSHRQLWALLESNINTTITPLPVPFQTQPSSNYTAIPYFHDPLTNTTMWHFQHGKSHKDMNQSFAGAWPWGQPITSSMNPVVPITDNDLQKPQQNMFWTFANYKEHLTAGNVTAPATPVPQNSIGIPI